MNTPETVQSRIGWDTIGVTASTLCLIHCVLTPIALSFAPVLSEFLPGDSAVHRVVIVLVVAIGLLAFIPGYRKHHKAIVFLPMLAGVWAIGLGAFGGLIHGTSGGKVHHHLRKHAGHHGTRLKSNVL